jgi:hypothetical protein
LKFKRYNIFFIDIANPFFVYSTGFKKSSYLFGRIKNKHKIKLLDSKKVISGIRNGQTGLETVSKD